MVRPLGFIKPFLMAECKCNYLNSLTFLMGDLMLDGLWKVSEFVGKKERFPIIFRQRKIMVRVIMMTGLYKLCRPRFKYGETLRDHRSV